MRQRAGRIISAGHTVELDFDAAGPQQAGAIDAAYRAKYAGSAYVDAMVSPRSQAATVRVTQAKR